MIDLIEGLLFIYLLILLWLEVIKRKKIEKHILFQREEFDKRIRDIDVKVNFLQERVKSLPIEKIEKFEMIKSFEEIKEAINSIFETTAVLMAKDNADKIDLVEKRTA